MNGENKENKENKEREPCVCCGLWAEDEPAACGHRFCYICFGREHDEDCVACADDKEI